MTRRSKLRRSYGRSYKESKIDYESIDARADGEQTARIVQRELHIDRWAYRQPDYL